MPGQRKKTIPKILKDLTWQKWIGDDIAKAKCLCCGINEIKMNSFHCGHVISEAMGGPTTVDNLIPVCATCNLSMRTQNMEKFKGQHGLGQGVKGMASPNSLIIADGNIRASTRIGSTDLSISVPISTVVQTVRSLF
jgi:esterase/lipase